MEKDTNPSCSCPGLGRLKRSPEQPLYLLPGAGLESFSLSALILLYRVAVSPMYLVVWYTETNGFGNG